MAIPILNHMDFQQKGEIRNVLLHKAGTGDISGNEAGQIIYDSGSIKFNNGSGWVTLGTGSGSGTVTQVDGGGGLTGSVTSSGSLAVGAGTGITVNTDDVAVTAAQTGITSVYNTGLKVGRAYVDATDHEMIDFASDGIIKLSVNGSEARWNGTGFVPGADDASDLGSSSKQWRNLYIDGTAEVDVLAINGTTVTSTAAELNILDGVTATATEINYLDITTLGVSEGSKALTQSAAGKVTIGATDGDQILDIASHDLVNGGLQLAGTLVTASAAELNILDGVTSTASELNILDGKAFLDEDNMASDSATGIASQQSIKAYVDGQTYDSISVANLKTKLAEGFASNAVQIGDSSDIVTIGKDLVVTGDLTVSGDTITANVGTLDVEDKNITLNKGASDTSSTANGAGITIQDAVNATTDASMTWDATDDEFDFSHGITAPKVSIDNLEINGNTIKSTDTNGGIRLTPNGTGVVVIGAGNLEYAGTAVTATGTELNYSDGVTSNIQTQLDAKEPLANKLTKKLSGDASTTSFTITHSFSTPIVGITVLDYGNNGSGATYDQVMVEIKRSSDNAVSLIFAAAPSATQDYLVLIEKFPAIS